MKKTLIILILVLAYQFTNAQVKVLGRIEPNGATDKYPTHVDSLGRGGLMTTASWQERNAIPVERRKAGMLVRVKSASVDSTYTLGVGLANVDWMPFTAGGSNTWGDLTGNLSDQGDLQAALNAKVSNAISVTYTDLTALIASNGLKADQYYVLTDFQTVHTIPNTSVVNTGPVERLVLRAATNNTLYTLATSLDYTTDVVYYRVTNSSVSTKGAIIRRIDLANGVDIPNDFRSVKYRRWKFNPVAWAAGSFATNVIVQHNNKIYYSLSATSDEPGTGTAWLEIIGDNTLYLSATSTAFSFSFGQFGGTVVIPVDASDFIDTVMFPNYNGVAGVNFVEGGYNNLANIVVYTDGQSFGCVRNTFRGGSADLTFVIKGNAYFYNNDFNMVTRCLFYINRTGSASSGFALSFNKFDHTTNSVFNVINAYYNAYRFMEGNIISGSHTYNDTRRVQSSVLGGTFQALAAPMAIRCIKSGANNIVVQSCQFLAPIGVRYNGTLAQNDAFTISTSLYAKVITGGPVGNTWTPNLISDLATKDVVYVGLPDVDISGKANLTGGNTFSGNQNVNGQISATSVYLDNTDTFAKLQSNNLNITDGGSVRSTDVGTGDVKLSYGSNGITLQPIGTPVANRTQYLQDASGTLALTSDIPKIFTYTTSGNGSNNMYSVPHGLSYTPTMVVVTPNSDDAMGVLENIKFAGARINGANIEIWYSELASVPPTGTNNLTWTIMVK